MDSRQVALNQAFHHLNRLLRKIRKQYETQEPLSKDVMESLILLLEFLEDNTMEGSERENPYF